MLTEKEITRLWIKAPGMVQFARLVEAAALRKAAKHPWNPWNKDNVQYDLRAMARAAIRASEAG